MDTHNLEDISNKTRIENSVFLHILNKYDLLCRQFHQAVLKSLDKSKDFLLYKYILHYKRKTLDKMHKYVLSITFVFVELLLLEPETKSILVSYLILFNILIPSLYQIRQLNLANI